MRRRPAWQRGGKRKCKALLRRLRRKLRLAAGKISQLATTCKWLADALYHAQLEIERLEHELASSETPTQV